MKRWIGLTSKIISPFNRVEGDLDVEVKFKENKVVDAKIVSRLFRGLELILRGKSPLDSLVITPRVCGICGASHLYASASALDMMFNAEVPRNAIRLRNVMSMAESCQNDLRHTYFMFLIDVVNKKYQEYINFEEVLKRFSPITGSSYKECFRWSKKYTEVYAVFGGQWPHGSAIIPGGVTSYPLPNEVQKAISILIDIRKNYLENVVLGGPVEQFLNTVKSYKDLLQWVEDYKDGDLSRIVEFGLEANWHKLGHGTGIMLSYGHLPFEEYVGSPSRKYFKPGIFFVKEKEYREFDQNNILEFVTTSYYTYSKGDEIGLHPFEGETNPNILDNSKKYSLTKCFRYKMDGNLLALEVGALAMLTVSSNPLILDIIDKIGPNVLSRVIARLVRVIIYNELMINELKDYEFGKPTYKKPTEVNEGKGFGLVEAPRGSLGHWIVVKNGKIFNYQMVTPTQINMGPEDPKGNKSHLSLALIGTEVSDINNPIEVYHIVRSHDPCMVCNVHMLKLI